ncbi:MAG: GPI anchored serine-threonine rich family protein [Candidatus Dormibacteria bacterium]
MTGTGTVTSSITITAPSTGTSWVRGTSHAITWSSAGSPGAHVKIQLLKAGKVVSTIVSSVLTSAGTFTWKIPATLALASTYQIKIVSTTTTSIFGLSADFSVT